MSSNFLFKASFECSFNGTTLCGYIIENSFSYYQWRKEVLPASGNSKIIQFKN